MARRFHDLFYPCCEIFYFMPLLVVRAEITCNPIILFPYDKIVFQLIREERFVFAFQWLDRFDETDFAQEDPVTIFMIHKIIFHSLLLSVPARLRQRDGEALSWLHRQNISFVSRAVISRLMLSTHRTVIDKSTHNREQKEENSCLMVSVLRII